MSGKAVIAKVRTFWTGLLLNTGRHIKTDTELEVTKRARLSFGNGRFEEGKTLALIPLFNILTDRLFDTYLNYAAIFMQNSTVPVI